MRAIFVSVATAAVGGLLMGAAFRPSANDLHEQPTGPQIVAYGAWEGDTGSASLLIARSGPTPEYVIGTDWTRPGNYQTDVAAIFDTQAYVEPVSYPLAAEAVPAVEVSAPVRISYASLDGDILHGARSAASSAVDALESFDDSARQSGEVVSADDQGGRQIDDLAHGADPDAVVSEPAA